MNFHVTQVYLLVWITVFWFSYFLMYGKVEGRHETSARERYGLKPKWAQYFGLTFMGWTLIILIYFFHQDFAGWLWKISFLDIPVIKPISMVMMCFAFVINFVFNMSVGKVIASAYDAGEKPQLVTTGIYSVIRHPGYLSFFAVALGTFLIIPNIITLLFMIFTFVVIYRHTLEEEHKLLLMYGKEYEEYMQRVGRYLPGLK